MLRINRDGSIPADNPFFGTATGVNRAIWALGLRNPFTTAIQRSTGRLFINDVGEVDLGGDQRGRAGRELRLAACGRAVEPIPITPTRFITTATASGVCAITGGAFYEPPVLAFPTAYRGDYFYADYCGGWIRRIDPVTGIGRRLSRAASAVRSTSRSAPTARFTTWRAMAVVGRISYSAAEPPAITLQPADRTVAVGTIGHLHGQRDRGRASHLSLATERQPDHGCDRCELYARQCAARGQRGVVRRDRVERFRLGDQRHRAADRHAEHGARCCDYAARRRDHLRGRIRDQLRRHRQRCRRRRPARQRIHMVGRPSP